MENNKNKYMDSLYNYLFDTYYMYAIKNGLGGSEAFIYATMQMERVNNNEESNTTSKGSGNNC